VSSPVVKLLCWRLSSFHKRNDTWLAQRARYLFGICLISALFEAICAEWKSDDELKNQATNLFSMRCGMHAAKSTILFVFINLSGSTEIPILCLFVLNNIPASVVGVVFSRRPFKPKTNKTAT